MECKICIGIIFIIVSAFLMLVSVLTGSNSFFNIRQIIKDHISLFEDDKKQYIIFYILPLMLAVGISLIYNAQDVFYSNLCVILSIILSMLFSVLSIITNFDYSRKEAADSEAVDSETSDSDKKIINVVKETCNSIIFTALLCTVLLIYSVVLLVLSDTGLEIKVIMQVLSGIAYYLFTVLLLNLLLVIKRIEKIIYAKLPDK